MMLENIDGKILQDCFLLIEMSLNIAVSTFNKGILLENRATHTFFNFALVNNANGYISGQGKYRKRSKSWKRT